MVHVSNVQEQCNIFISIYL